MTNERRAWYKELHWQIAVAMVAAFVVGWLLRQVDPGAEWTAVYASIEFVGVLFMRLLRMIIVPLVFASIVVGISTIDVANLGRMGLKTLAYYTLTTSMAVTVGLVLVLVVRPGAGVVQPVCESDDDCGGSFACVDAACRPTLEPTPVADVFAAIIPENPFASLAQTFDLLGVIFFGILFAIAIAVVGREAKPVRDFFVSLDKIMTRITDWVMKTAPVGIFALLVQIVVVTGVDLIGDLAMYMITVAAGLLFHALVTLPIIVAVFARVHPFAVIRALAPALLTAFSTASSAATLPLTLDCTTRRAGVDRRVGSFVLPMGATVNMDGTALYEAVAAIFIAQAFGIDLSFGQQVVIFVTATLAAIGAAGVPSAGLVTMIIVLQAVGLPLEGIGMLVAVDRILDMLRTSVNVWGDAAGSVVIAHSEGRLDRDVLYRRAPRVDGDASDPEETAPDLL